jgi:hypothetical protein
LSAGSPPPVALNTDPAKRAAVEASVKVSHLFLDEDRQHPGRWRVNMDHLAFGVATPVGLAFDVVLRSGGREWPAGAMSAAPGDRVFRVTGRSLPPDFTAERVDVLFRPSVEAAEQRVDLEEIWCREVERKDVRVIR